MQNVKKTSQEILNDLENERSKFTNSNTDLMQKLVDELVANGEYPIKTPTMEKYGYSHLKMVQCWGSKWHIFEEPLECPHCKADLRSLNGPPFKREIGIYSRDQDRTIRYDCPDCHKTIELR
jgi:glutaredoxin